MQQLYCLNSECDYTIQYLKHGSTIANEQNQPYTVSSEVLSTTIAKQFKLGKSESLLYTTLN